MKMTQTEKYPIETSKVKLQHELKDLKDNGFKYMAWYGYDKCFNIQLINK